jgi:alpha-1,2-mannosyltransferase
MTRASQPPNRLDWPERSNPGAPVWLLPLGLLLGIASWNISAPRNLFSDYLKGYYPAGRSLWSADYSLESLYQSVAFVNLPIVSVILAPFSAISPPAIAAAAFFAAGLLATAMALWILCRLADPRRPVQIAIIATLTLVNGPLIYSLREGNTTHFVLLLLALYISETENRSSYIGGCLVGVASIIKLPLLIFLLYFIATGRFRSAAGFLIVVSASFVASIYIFGLETHETWYKSTIEPFSGGVVGAYNVQTIDSFVLRLFTGPLHLRDYLPHQRSIEHAAIRVTAIVTLISLSWIAVRRYRGTQADRDILSFCLVLILALMASPLSWSHYFSLLLVCYALYLGGRLPLSSDRCTQLLIGCGIVLGSLPVLRGGYAILSGEIVARTLASCTFAGAALLLAGLLWGSAHYNPRTNHEIRSRIGTRTSHSLVPKTNKRSSSASLQSPFSRDRKKYRGEQNAK